MSNYDSPLISSSSEASNGPASDAELDKNLFDAEAVDTSKADIFGESLSDLSAEEAEEANSAVEQPQSPRSSNLNDESWTVRLKIPRIRIDQGMEMHFIKLPVFLNIESRPFDAETFEHEEADPTVADELETKRSRLKIENTIRWRTVETENGPRKQSNARFVQWSDGSLSFYVGNKVFDVYKTNIVGDHNHLFVRHGSYLHGQALFRTKLTFRPHSSDSNASARINIPIGRRSLSNQQKIRILSSAGQNPDISRIELLKQEGRRLRKEERRRNLLERRKEESRTARRQMSERFLERNEEEESDTGDYSDAGSDKASDGKVSDTEGEGANREATPDSDADTPVGRRRTRVYASSEDTQESE